MINKPVAGGESGLDPRTEKDADEEDGAAGEHEVGEIQQVSDQHNEQVPGKSPEKHGDHVSMERITACGTEDPENVERYERNQRSEPDRKKGRFHEIMDSALVDIALTCPLDPGIPKGEIDGLVVHEAGDHRARNGGERDHDGMVGSAKENQRGFMGERNERVGGNAVEEKKR